MDKRTAQALEDSIAHWKRLFECETVESLEAEGLGLSSCALCGVFYFCGCVGCPVMARTTRCRCEETPYKTAVAEFSARGSYSRGWSWEKWRVAAREELEFLESLRAPRTRE